jgi:hypothetical protein
MVQWLKDFLKLRLLRQQLFFLYVYLRVRWRHFLVELIQLIFLVGFFFFWKESFHHQLDTKYLRYFLIFFELVHRKLKNKWIDLLKWVVDGLWAESLDWTWIGFALTYLANLWAIRALGAVLVFLLGAID